MRTPCQLVYTQFELPIGAKGERIWTFFFNKLAKMWGRRTRSLVGLESFEQLSINNGVRFFITSL